MRIGSAYVKIGDSKEPEVNGLNKFLVVDFETTGNKPKDGDKIIQIGAVLIEDGEITSQFSTLINPGIPIPAFIQQLTQINDEMVKDAPTIEEIIPKLLPLLEGAAFVAHNVFFDLNFLQFALADCGYIPFSGSLIDTVELSRLLLPNQTGYKLSELSSELEVEHESPHQADSDALATAQIFLTLLDKLNRLPLLVIQRLAELTKSFASDISRLIHKLEQRRILEGNIDGNAEGLEMYRQLAIRLPMCQENRRTVSPGLHFEEFVLGLHEQLPQEMPDFEWRPAQREMMMQIYDSFAGSRHLLVEAGTGTGKSLAYLVPAMYWARESGERVVISTHTIQLQEQLFARDLPLMEKVFESGVQTSILKGRNNYLCLRKYETSLFEASDNYDLQLSKGQILTWLTETETGDVEEVNLPSGGQHYWRQVQSDANSCLSNQCPWFSRCFYYSARRKAHDADVIITNHSLLFTDMKADQRILPSYRYAIIDEAHQFEEVASHHLGRTLHSAQLEGLFSELISDKGTGLLERLQRECGATPIWDGLREDYAQIIPFITEAKDYARELFNLLYTYGIRTAKEGVEAGRRVQRYVPGGWKDKSAETIQPAANYCIEWLSSIQKSMEKLYIGIQEDKESGISLRGLATDLNGMIKEVGKYKQLIQLLLLEPDEGSVYWMEMDIRSNRRLVFLNMVPIDVAPLLQEQFFAPKESVVLTSATLSVNKSFTYALDRIGLESEEVSTIQHLSPFDYRKQTFLCVPSDIPSLKTGEEGEFISRLTESLVELARVTEGRMLVLFTSYQMLRRVHEPLREVLAADGFTVLGHGTDSSSRSKLTKLFKNTPKSILLGTSSFWEGVDIPGDALSCLAIVRLPFWPPNHPVVEARSEQIKERKGNPFMELSVPQAVIRFKQGFGRLVRTQRDKGIVIVFDRRIVDSRYGKYFLNSLPDTPLYQRPMKELLPLIGKWLG